MYHIPTLAWTVVYLFLTSLQQQTDPQPQVILLSMFAESEASNTAPVRTCTSDTQFVGANVPFNAFYRKSLVTRISRKC